MSSEALPTTVLVTGAAGFVGSHLVERLLAEGVCVVGLDNFDPYYGPEQKVANLSRFRDDPRFTFVEADLRAENTLAAAFEAGEIAAVVHLAARAGVRASVDAVREYFEINLTGTLNLLEAMRSRGIGQFVFASSSSVYADSEVPFREEMAADRPLQPYAASKRAAEMLAHTYAHLHGFHVTVTRLFSAYGPRLRPDLAIHKFARRIVRGEPIQIYGDGSAERDLTYVADIVDGLVAALCRPFRFEIVNLGNSRTVSLAAVIDALEAHLGAKAIREYGPPNPSDLRITYADISKAERLLGYRPRVPFEEGIRRFCEWFRSEGVRYG